MFYNPKDNKVWRSNYAVLEIWNEGTHMLEATVKKDVYGWLGSTSSQQVWIQSQNPNQIEYRSCILPGGKPQLWLDNGFLSDDLNKYFKIRVL